MTKETIDRDMPAPTKGARLGGSAAHQKIILANLATQLFEHGRITTTEAKARRLRPLAEKLITKAKRGDIHSRRLVLTTVKDKGVVHVLFTEIAPTLRRSRGRLHPDHQGRPAQGRQRPDGGDRAGHRVGRGEQEGQREGRRLRPRRPRPRRRRPSAAAAPAASEPVGGSSGRGTGQRHRGAGTSRPASRRRRATTPPPRRRRTASTAAEPPAGLDIKGNEDSMKYHTPESQCVRADQRGGLVRHREGG